MIGRTAAELATFVIGPDSRGRSFGLLGRSVQPELAADLAMSLAAWAETGETDFVAWVPQPEGSVVVVRARNLGRASFGHLAFMNGIVVPASLLARGRDWPELLLAALQQPDGSLDFAEHTVLVDLPGGVRAPDPYLGIDVGWNKWAIMAGPTINREQILVRLLRGILEPAQRAHVVGWATTINLPSRGRLNSASPSQFPLLIGKESAGLVDQARLVARIDRDGWHGPQGVAPATYQQWQALAAEILPELATGWQASYAALKSAQIVAEFVRAASQSLRPAAMAAVFARLLGSDAAHRAGAAPLLLDYVMAMAARGQDLGPFADLLAQSADATATLLAIDPTTARLLLAEMPDAVMQSVATRQAALAMALGDPQSADALLASLFAHWPPASNEGLLDVWMFPAGRTALLTNRELATQFVRQAILPGWRLRPANRAKARALLAGTLGLEARWTGESAI